MNYMSYIFFISIIYLFISGLKVDNYNNIPLWSYHMVSIRLTKLKLIIMNI